MTFSVPVEVPEETRNSVQSSDTDSVVQTKASQSSSEGSSDVSPVKKAKITKGMLLK